MCRKILSTGRQFDFKLYQRPSLVIQIGHISNLQAEYKLFALAVKRGKSRFVSSVILAHEQYLFLYWRQLQELFHVTKAVLQKFFVYKDPGTIPRKGAQNSLIRNHPG